MSISSQFIARLILASLLIIVVFSLSVSGTWFPQIGWGIIAVLVFTGFVSIGLSKTVDLFSPMALVSMLYILFTWMPLLRYALVGPKDYVDVSHFNLIPITSWLIVVGVAAMWFGYRSSLGSRIAHRLPSMYTDIPLSHIIYFLTMLYPLSVGIRTWDLWNGYGSASVINAIYGQVHNSYMAISVGILVRLFNDFGLLTLAGWAWLSFSKQRTLRLKLNPVYMMIFVGLSEALLRVLSGWKSSGITILFVLATTYWYSSQTPKISVLAKFFSIGLTSLFLLFPIVDAYRTAMRLTGNAIPPIHVVLESWPNADLVKILDLVIRRIDGLTGPLLVLSNVPNETPFLFGSTLSPILLGFIPHQILPGRMTESAGALYARQMLGWADSSQGAITHVGDLYWNFGLPGVIIGMFSLGIIYQLVYTFLIKKNGFGHSSQIVYATILLPLIHMEGSVASSLVPPLQYLVEFCFMLLIVKLLKAFFRMRGLHQK